MKNLLKLLAVSSIALVPISQASAASITNLSDYVKAQDANAVLVKDFSLAGLHQYTAINKESGHNNTTALEIDGEATFSSKKTAEFGIWKDVNFTTQNIFFNDTTDGNPVNVALNNFMGDYFQVFKLSQNIMLNNIWLKEDSYIVGFGDGQGDKDYDDFIVGVNGVSAVPIPATAFLLTPALLGFLGLRRKKSA